MKLMDQVRHSARVKHFSYRTEQSYVQWITRYIRFHGIRHPNTMGAAEIEAFRTHLAVEGKVSASTQNQALGALLFLYRDMLKIEVGRLDAVRARRPVRVPMVLSAGEVGELLKALDELPTEEPYGLMGQHMYGARLRLMECCRLRIKDFHPGRLKVSRFAPADEEETFGPTHVQVSSPAHNSKPDRRRGDLRSRP